MATNDRKSAEEEVARRIRTEREVGKLRDSTDIHWTVAVDLAERVSVLERALREAIAQVGCRCAHKDAHEPNCYMRELAEAALGETEERQP